MILSLEPGHLEYSLPGHTVAIFTCAHRPLHECQTLQGQYGAQAVDSLCAVPQDGRLCASTLLGIFEYLEHLAFYMHNPRPGGQPAPITTPRLPTPLRPSRSPSRPPRAVVSSPRSTASEPGVCGGCQRDPLMRLGRAFSLKTSGPTLQWGSSQRVNKPLLS